MAGRPRADPRPRDPGRDPGPAPLDPGRPVAAAQRGRAPRPRSAAVSPAGVDAPGLRGRTTRAPPAAGRALMSRARHRASLAGRLRLPRDGPAAQWGAGAMPRAPAPGTEGRDEIPDRPDRPVEFGEIAADVLDLMSIARAGRAHAVMA